MRKTDTRSNEPTPLARFVSDRLAQIEMRQSEFCRIHQFDQGLLSKIQNSMITNLSLESALKLATGLSVPPARILDLTGRPDLDDLVIGQLQARRTTSRPLTQTP